MADYKRTQVLINSKFQLKFTFLVCFILVVSSSFYPISLYELFGIMGENFPEKATELNNLSNSFMLTLLLLQFGFLGLVFVALIFMTHKIAGPMFKLKKSLREFRAENNFKPIFFRKGDYFQDVADEINETLSDLINKRNSDFTYLDEVNSYLANISLVLPDDKKATLKEIQAKLVEIQNRYN